MIWALAVLAALGWTAFFVCFHYLKEVIGHAEWFAGRLRPEDFDDRAQRFMQRGGTWLR